MAEVTETNQRRTPLSWTLDLYVLRLFAVLYAGNLLCLTLIYVCIDAVENLDDFSARTSTVGQLASLALRYYLAIVPVVFCQLLGPVVALTAGLFTVTLFHQSNEFVPMLSAGRPHWRIFLPILAGAVVVSLGTFLLQELWIPRTAATVREVRGKKKGMEVLLHRKHLDLKSGVLIKINRYHVLERRAEGVTVLPLMPAGGRSDAREYLIQAREMLWVEPELQKKSPYWLLKDGQLQTYDEEGRLIPPPAPAGLTVRPLFLSFVERPLATNLTPEDLESQQQEVPLWLTDLRRKMRESLDRRWPVMYYSRFAGPLSALVLLLVGLPLITHYGSRNVFFGALVAAVVASAYFMLSSTFSNLALRGFLPAPLGPWLAPILFASLGITWTRYLRTG